MDTQTLWIIAAASLVGAFIGWLAKPAPKVKAAPAKAGASSKSARTDDPAARERIKKLEDSLQKAKSSLGTLRQDHETLQAASVSKTDAAVTLAELADARKALEASAGRIAALEAEGRKAQENIRSLNARSNDAGKARKEREFALENELSKARHELAEFHARPDDTSTLQAEIERLRESVAVTTRYTGELRKRETAALEALAAAEKKLSEAPANDAPVTDFPPRKSDRIAAAKAEVERLHALNAERSATPAEELPTEDKALA